MELWAPPCIQGGFIRAFLCRGDGRNKLMKTEEKQRFCSMYKQHPAVCWIGRVEDEVEGRARGGKGWDGVINLSNKLLFPPHPKKHYHRDVK